MGKDQGGGSIRQGGERRASRNGGSIAGKESLRNLLQALYAAYNRPEYISPDPLEVVLRYRSRADREVAGLIAATLAYGRVSHILASVRRVLDVMGESPRAYLDRATYKGIRRAFRGFRHRWTTDEELTRLLHGVGRVVCEHGSLEACYLGHTNADDGDSVAGLAGFVDALLGGAPYNSLLPNPIKGSACKRLHMYLRWMVRRDAVDPGCWSGISPARLLVPVDTHMHAIARRIGLTGRNQADLRTAREITDAFRRFAPDDPVRYDFALTRFGIRGDLSLEQLVREWRGTSADKVPA